MGRRRHSSRTHFATIAAWVQWSSMGNTATLPAILIALLSIHCFRQHDVIHIAETAIDGNSLAVDKGRLVAQKKCHHFSHLLRPAISPQVPYFGSFIRL